MQGKTAKSVKKLAFKGGTALRRCHFSEYRFSEDLDFDNLRMKEEVFEKISLLIRKSLEQEGYTIEMRTVYRGAYHCYIRFPDLLYRESLSAHPEEKILIQLDTEPQHFDFTPQRYILNRFDVFTTVFITPLDILLAQKLYAIINRERNKGRDFYDTVFLLSLIDKPNYDPLSRVNSFVHVNHSKEVPRYGVLLCVNGTGILNSWLRNNFFNDTSYEQMNKEASAVSAGSDDLLCYPFGNGAERVLENKDLGAMMKNLQFNRHHRGHIARAAQEGIVFALHYGMEIMKEMGMEIKTVRAGFANMFLSEVFCEAFVNTTGTKLELYNTDGAIGAARGAGIGAGIYKEFSDAYKSMEKIKTVEPKKKDLAAYSTVYSNWKQNLGI
jgi:hypothetical protein